MHVHLDSCFLFFLEENFTKKQEDLSVMLLAHLVLKK